MATYTSQYPPAHNDTYVKATSLYSSSFCSYFATDPANSLTGDSALNTWAGASTNQRFHIDLGSAKIIRRIYYENYHNAGGSTTSGAKTFTVWGSNEATAFDELTYGTDTNWTQITASVATLDKHTALDSADPKYFTINNSVKYRYYAFKFADNYTGAYMGLRRIVLQTEDGFPPSGPAAVYLSDYGFM